jgi:hypothetical protein
MRFNASKSPLLGLLFLFLSIVLLGLATTAILEGGTIGGIIALILVLCTILFIGTFWFHTYYIVENEELTCVMGFTKIKVPILAINRIVYTYRFAFYYVKPALNMSRGLKIYYNQYDEIYVSPADRAAFIEELKKVKPEIVIEEKQ